MDADQPPPGYAQTGKPSLNIRAVGIIQRKIEAYVGAENCVCPGCYQSQILLDDMLVPQFVGFGQEGRDIGVAVADAPRDASQVGQQGAPPVVGSHDDCATEARPPQTTRPAQRQQIRIVGAPTASKSGEGQRLYLVDRRIARKQFRRPGTAKHMNLQIGARSL